MTTTNPQDAVTVDVPVTSVIPNVSNIRAVSNDDDLAGLAESILSVGVINPLTVTPDEHGTYTLLAGHRRHRALMLLIEQGKLPKAATCPVNVLNDVSGKQVTALMLVENLQRLDVAPIDEAKGYQHLVATYGMKPKELAKTIGKSLAHINDRLALLGLPEDAYDMVGSLLPLGQALPIAKLKDVDEKKKLIKAARKGQLAEWQVASAVRREKQDEEKAAVARLVEKLNLTVHGALSEVDLSWREVERMEMLTSEMLAKHVVDPALIYVGRNGYIDTYRRRTEEEIAEIERNDQAGLREGQEWTPWHDWNLRNNEYEDMLQEFQERQYDQWGMWIRALSRRDLTAAVLEVASKQCRVQASYYSPRTDDLCELLGLKGWETSTEAANILTTYVEMSDTNAHHEFLAHAVHKKIVKHCPKIMASYQQHLESVGLAVEPERPADLGIEPWQDDEGNWVTDRPEPEDVVAPDEHLESAYEDLTDLDPDGDFDEVDYGYDGDDGQYDYE